MDDNNNQYSDFSNVEAQRNFLTKEEFPEGSFGSDGYDSKGQPVYNRSQPWEEGQRYHGAFNYEYKNMHQDIPRQFPQAHQPNDDPDENTQRPYDDYAPE